MTSLLEVVQLVKRFPVRGEAPLFWLRENKKRVEVFAIDDVSLSIEPGETVGLVGETGCGKSTLVRLIARLLDASAGNIIFDGVDIGLTPAQLFSRAPQRASIQVVFQDPTNSLNPRYTAFDAIADPVRQLRPGRSQDIAARVKESARLCGLADELLGRFPHQLSGGQKARIGIARAIAVQPRLLVLDEPTSSLDVSVQAVILHLLDDLKRRLGFSCLFVSHDLNIVRLICDRLYVMYSGKVVENGPTARVFSAPAHPYTAALISAIPSLDISLRDKRIQLPGEVASPVNPDPHVCCFYQRCPNNTPLCAKVMPALAPVARGQFAACHFPLVPSNLRELNAQSRSVNRDSKPHIPTRNEEN